MDNQVLPPVVRVLRLGGPDPHMVVRVRPRRRVLQCPLALRRVRRLEVPVPPTTPDQHLHPVHHRVAPVLLLRPQAV